MRYTPGRYRAKAVQGTFAHGFTSGGKDQTAGTFLLLEGPDEGKRITWYGYYGPNSVEFTLDALRNAGWRGDDLADLSMIGDAQSPECVLVIEDEQGLDGEVRSRVKWVNRGLGPALNNRMNDAQRTDFARRMKGHILQHNTKNAQASAAARPPVRQPPRQQAFDGTRADDDIPF